MVSDLDGADLRDYLDSVGGHAPIRVGRAPEEISTGRSGIVTCFSSGGPTRSARAQAGHRRARRADPVLDAARVPGAQFAVFDGTSMAAPHVTGAAALLAELHPDWTPPEVKSALVATAGPAWANTARTQEAPGRARGRRADQRRPREHPSLFTDPVSLSFGDLDVNHGTQIESMLVSLTDAGGGAGTWTVGVQPQVATNGSSVDVQGTLTRAAGRHRVPAGAGRGARRAEPPATTRASSSSRRGAEQRRIPYLFLVTRPALERETAVAAARAPDRRHRLGASNASDYRFPAGPFAQAFSSLTTPTREDGAEKLYVFHVNDALVELRRLGAGAVRRRDRPVRARRAGREQVQGYAATPFDVNALHVRLPRAGRVGRGRRSRARRAYYVAVDSPRDVFTGERLDGKYLLNAWANDVTPPTLQVLTKRVAAGRPTLAVRSVDFQSGVDPFSLVISYRRVLLGASAYDPFSGVAIFGIPRNAPTIPAGRTPATALSYDFQETKNVDQAGDNVLPNTAFRDVRIRGVARARAHVGVPAAARVHREDRAARSCSRATCGRSARCASRSTGTAIGSSKNGQSDLYSLTWKRGSLKRGQAPARGRGRGHRRQDLRGVA